MKWHAEIVDYNHMKKELYIRTVKAPELQYGKKLEGAIFHSDRESQYTSEVTALFIILLRLILKVHLQYQKPERRRSQTDSLSVIRLIPLE